MIDEYIDHINARIRVIGADENFDLKTLFGDGWEQLLPGQRKKLGTEFYKAVVEEHRFPEIEHVELCRSPRRDIYRIKQ